jgi:hypothetical protein
MYITLVKVQLVDPEHQAQSLKTINVAETKLKSAAVSNQCKTRTDQRETPTVSQLSMKSKQLTNKSRNKSNHFKISRIQVKVLRI